MSRLAVVVSVLVGAIVVAAVCAVLGNFVIHGEVTAHTLQMSVGEAADSVGSGDRCRRGSRPGTWRCGVIDHDGSGGVVYRVTVDPGSSCWHGEVVLDQSEGTPLPRTIEGCVHAWQWTLI